MKITKENILKKYDNYVEELIDDFYNENNLDRDLLVDDIINLPEFKLEYEAIDYISALLDFSDFIYNYAKITDLIVYDGAESGVCNLELKFNNQEEFNNFFDMLESAELINILLNVYYKIYLDLSNYDGTNDSYNECIHIISVPLNVRIEKGDLTITW